MPRLPEEDSTRIESGLSRPDLGGLDHLAGGLELDRTGEVEAFALQEEGNVEHGAEIDVQVLNVEVLRRADNGHVANL
jgi:hypothetical protein